ncbi:ATP-dependent RNA helicase suv3 [Lachnellula suecica]|uniref:RNA helicase n=1 Tax=Lachnellula suecica TaxID=602035 RepID=A0A8T9C4N2_9HELO|nr:ATP-dependent RNA helicase suv3 [Lachnellula suecica]
MEQDERDRRLPILRTAGYRGGSGSRREDLRNGRFNYQPAARPGEIISTEHRPLLGKESAYDTFGALLQAECTVMGSKLRTGELNRQRIESWGIETRGDLEDELEKFRQRVKQACDRATRRRLVGKAENPLFYHLRQAFITGHTPGLGAQLKIEFMTSIIRARHSTEATSGLQQKIADLRYPIEWYPATRALHRTVHLHVGPTNSGKTYHALQKLEAARTGIYAGPLRLLAHEVYTRFNAKGKKCALITGEERRIPDGLDLVMNSCTVEMVPLNTLVDVAVIDEIQMLGDADRGWAWTQAFLGVMAKEVHLCGELRVIPLIKELCAAMGDKLVIHRYERLGALESESKSLKGDLQKLEKGDAVILFSRFAIHAMKANIEKAKGRRCAVVYGSLPPETRAQQAALFNDPDNDYDYLVASNAVGMGLNLSIKRVIFESTSKHNGLAHVRLSVPEINQIAGRAGRYKSAHDAIKNGTNEAGDSVLPAVRSRPTTGLVTTLDFYDLPIVKDAMKTVVPPLKAAGILPTADVILRFVKLFPAETPLSYILVRLNELCTLTPQFFMCQLKEQLEVADLLHPYKMSILDRVAFLTAPATLREPGFASVLVEFAQSVSQNSGGELLDMKSIPLEVLEKGIHDDAEGVKGYLRKAELLHKALTLYLWLSYRFAGVFRSQALAFHVKGLVEEKIDECLADIRYDIKDMRKKNLYQHKIMQQEELLRKQIESEESTVDDAATEGDDMERLGDDATGHFEVTAESGDDSAGTVDEELADFEMANESEDSPSSNSNIPATVGLDDRKPDATISTV